MWAAQEKDYLLRVIKPNMYVGILHGIMPFKLKKVGDFTELKAELISFNCLYSICFYTGVCILCLNFRDEPTMHITTILWPIIMLLIYWLKTKQCVSFFQLVNKFDAKMTYGEDFIDECSKRRNFWFIWSSFLYAYTFIAYLGLYQEIFYDSAIPIWKISVCFLVSFLMRIPRILIGFFFVIICDELVRRFRFVRKNFTLRVREKSKGFTPDDNFFILEEMRIDYFNLVKAAETGSSFFGDALLIVLCQNLYETFHLFYKIIILSESITFSMVLHYFYDYYMVHSMTTAAENMIKASKSIVKDLRCLPLQYLPDSWLNQIEIMSVQIQAIPLVISASGYFNINRSLLLSILTSIVMYLIVLIQLAPIVKKIEKEAAEN